MLQALWGLLVGAFPIWGAPLPVCSAHHLTLPLPEQDGLPRAVAQMRQRIVQAAVQCDVAQLEMLALAGRPGFSYTFGQASTPAHYWREQEKKGDNPLWFLYKIMSRPFHVERGGKETLYVWPSAYQDQPEPADWQALSGIYPEQEIKTYQGIGVYMGHRVGMTPTGDWLFFIAGD